MILTAAVVCYLCCYVEEGWVGEGSNPWRLGQRGLGYMVLDGRVSMKQGNSKVKRGLGLQYLKEHVEVPHVTRLCDHQQWLLAEAESKNGGNIRAP